MDGLNYRATGREVGLTGSRVAELLRIYFGVDARPLPEARIRSVPAESMLVLRDSVLGRMEGVTESLLAAITTGSVADALEALDDVRRVWREVKAEEDTDLHVGNETREALVTRALRDHAEARRSVGDDDAANVCDRLLAAMP